MSFFSSLDLISQSMSVQRTRMNVAAMNLANKSTTRTAEGGPYRRRDVVVEAVPWEQQNTGLSFESSLMQKMGKSDVMGVSVREVEASDDEPLMLYEPGHPDADPNGYVAYPNVSGVKEMVNMMSASRAYEASAKTMQMIRQMAENAIKLGKRG